MPAGVAPLCGLPGTTIQKGAPAVPPEPLLFVMETGVTG